MKKGIHQWSFPEIMSIKDRIRLAKDAGFDGIELMIHPDKGISLESSVKGLNELRNFANEVGLEIKTLSFKYLNWLTSNDKEKRFNAVQNISKALEIAKHLEAETLLVIVGGVDVSIFDPSEEIVSYDNAYVNAIEGLKELIPVAEKFNVDIGIENVPTKFIMSPLEFARIIDEVGNSMIGAYLDVGNARMFGYPEQWIRILGTRIKKVHIKDFKAKIGTISGFAPLLEGDVNWKEVIKAFNEVGYNNYLTAEILPPFKFFPEILIYNTSKCLDSIIKGT